MYSVLVLIDSQVQWQPYHETESVITIANYLQNDTLSKQRYLVINLATEMSSQSEGYYCSLLAQARGHKVIPDVEVLNRLESGSLLRLEPPLQKTALRWIQSKQVEGEASLHLSIYFGNCHEPGLERIARRIFEEYPAPLLQVAFSTQGDGQIESIRTVGLNELTEPQQTLFADALDRFSKKVWRQPRAKKPARYDLAIFYDPAERLPPSDKGTLNLFVSQGKKLGLNVELITPLDATRLMEFDALFIRQTTALNHITYKLAHQAQQADMVVIDDPLSIIRCTNKVYLKELLEREGVPIPRSQLLFKTAPQSYEAMAQLLGPTLVLKVPDGSFSVGVKKVTNQQEYDATLDALFDQSAILLAQEYLPTEFDWRIGILDGEPLYACKYFMAKGHWQIYDHQGSRPKSGGWETVPVTQVPKIVVRTALKAANLIGKGLYGVDLKLMDGQCVVIEVNDNPSIDHGVEDQILGDELYRVILREFIDRLERKHRSPS